MFHKLELKLMIYKVDYIKLKKIMKLHTMQEKLVKKVILNLKIIIKVLINLIILKTNKIKYRSRKKHKVNCYYKDIKITKN